MKALKKKKILVQDSGEEHVNHDSDFHLPAVGSWAHYH